MAKSWRLEKRDKRLSMRLPNRLYSDIERMWEKRKKTWFAPEKFSAFVRELLHEAVDAEKERVKRDRKAKQKPN